jgi:hypothetical protein
MGRLLAAAALAAALAFPAGATAADAPYLPWTSLLPALPGPYSESVWEDCADGDPGCVEDTLDEMYRRYGEYLAADCDHNAVFALTYIRVTEAYANVAGTGFFEEERFLAHEDAVFARLYFDAHDAWHEGRIEDVPLAWRVALETAAARDVPAIADMLLGMNAHVNRDMPFMLAGLGLVKPDGTSRKRDHDAFNELLNAVYDDVIAEIAQRFDPTTAVWDPEFTTLDNLLIFQLLPLWREVVWRHAELLRLAPTPEARAAIGQWIETYAFLQAQLIREAFRYRGGQTSAARDAWCLAHAGTAEDARPG